MCVCSWWSSSGVSSSRRRCAFSCFRTFRISSGKSQRSRRNIPETWRNWPRGSWPRLAAPRTISST
ncbi:hypothetical protein NQZ68_038274, partial [Dissostichus eleginoides]